MGEGGDLGRGRFTIRRISFLEGLGFPSNPITKVKRDLGSWPYAAAHHETPWAFRISSGQIPTAEHRSSPTSRHYGRFQDRRRD